MKARETNCPAEFTLAMIGGRWKIPLIFHLLAGAKRFSELSRELTGVSQKMLTQQLREMERNGLVERKVYAQVPPKVEYALTSLGRSLKPVVDAMCQWGELHGAQTASREAQP
ncbi:MAG: helix-turn-helix transcriptional regulator [Deltaproteobacteria bacterium]|jgi:DNA-binding HxlR family transcriptional regulator|nr:MAG: helix-turn-helix transcriptional regulator [Deltaproteobacteria bacterium]